MTINEWADRYRRIAPEFSCEPGAWNTKRVPYLRAIMRACSPSDPCQRIIFAKPSQVGGSEVILNALGYLIDLNPRSVLVIFPTVELAQSKILTAAIDVADRSLAYEVVGWGPNRESWGIETGEFPGDVGDPASGLWDQIDRFVYRRLFRCEDGKLARVRLLFIDSGGHHTTTVYKYAKPRQPRVFAIKGLGGPGRAMIVGGKSTRASRRCLASQTRRGCA